MLLLTAAFLNNNRPLSLFSLCRRSEKHPSVPGAKQDEGLLLHRQPGPRRGLQDQDHREVALVRSRNLVPFFFFCHPITPYLQEGAVEVKVKFKSLRLKHKG